VLPLKKRVFDLQQNLSAAGALHNPISSLSEIVRVCHAFKSQDSSRSATAARLDELNSLLTQWGQRDLKSKYRVSPNPALTTTSSALRLLKQWTLRVISTEELQTSPRLADAESHHKAIERVLLQQRCALSEWLKHENSNHAVIDAIKLKLQAASDARRSQKDRVSADVHDSITVWFVTEHGSGFRSFSSHSGPSGGAFVQPPDG
jgi:hypothetical protein